MLDSFFEGIYGGGGVSFDWDLASLAKKRHQRLILSGGLKEENVVEAIKKVRPYAVDVSSGVERAPGKKDWAKLERFLRKVKGDGEIT